MRNKMWLLVLMLLICMGVSGCSLSRSYSYSKSVAEISGSSSSWTGEKRKEIEFEKGQTVTFRYQSKWDRGDLSIQLIGPRGEVVHEFEVNKQANLEKEIREEGIYVIRISGTDFKGSYQVEW